MDGIRYVIFLLANSIISTMRVLLRGSALTKQRGRAWIMNKLDWTEDWDLDVSDSTTPLTSEVLEKIRAVPIETAHVQQQMKSLTGFVDSPRQDQPMAKKRKRRKRPVTKVIHHHHFHVDKAVGSLISEMRNIIKDEIHSAVNMTTRQTSTDSNSNSNQTGAVESRVDQSFDLKSLSSKHLKTSIDTSNAMNQLPHSDGIRLKEEVVQIPAEDSNYQTSDSIIDSEGELKTSISRFLIRLDQCEAAIWTPQFIKLREGLDDSFSSLALRAKQENTDTDPEVIEMRRKWKDFLINISLG